jgi:uncharacterized DUF497 family protein
MDCEWDETKRLSNILKHGIDFADAIEVLEGDFAEAEDLRRPYGERRFLVTGELRGELIRLVFTWRGERRRIISVRRARQNERRAYYARDLGPSQENEKSD